MWLMTMIRVNYPEKLLRQIFYYVAQDGLEPKVLLQLPECRNYPARM